MIAYDTNILIYALEGTSPWAKAAQSIVEQGERDGAFLSVLVWQELMTGAVLNDSSAGETLTQVLRDLNATRFTPVTQAICQRAVTLTKQYGKQVYGYDAIHLATALEHKIGTFVTNDKLLLGLRVDGLVIKGL